MGPNYPRIILLFAIMGWGCEYESGDNLGNSNPDMAVMNDMPDMAEMIAAPPVGSAWFIDSESGQWVQPDGAERLLALAPDGLALWLAVHAVNGAQMDLMLAVGGADTQDRCIRTIVMAAVELKPERHFQFGPADFVLPNGISAENLVVEAQFTEDLTGMTNLSARGQIDLESVPADVLSMLDGDDRCGVVRDFLSVDCVACKDGRSVCLNIEMAGFVGTARPVGSIVEVQSADCHADCAASSENAECDLSDDP